MKDKKLLFVKTQDDDLAKPDGEADLTTGRGVRSKKECAKTVEWPNDVKEELCFGIAVENGTYYLIGGDADNVKYANKCTIMHFTCNGAYDVYNYLLKIHFV